MSSACRRMSNDVMSKSDRHVAWKEGGSLGYHPGPPVISITRTSLQPGMSVVVVAVAKGAAFPFLSHPPRPGLPP